ncbi:MAG: phosphoribosylglycinamide formyltransferase [Dokdonella sp.]
MESKPAPLPIVVFASGRGSNFQALLNAERAGRLNIEIRALLCDRSRARALELARAANVPAIALDHKAFADRPAFDQALFARAAEFAPALIVLAGFMRILDPAAMSPWIGRMINIHPSLLPKYPGLHTHQRALDADDARHGSSVHFVSAELDGGPVIARTEIAIGRGDTAEQLAARLLPYEHRLLCASVELFARGRIVLKGGAVQIDGHPLAQPLAIDSAGRLG